MSKEESYLLSGQPSELERLQLQARVWEPAGRRLLQRLIAPPGAHALDVGCGAWGWLRLLDEWVGEGGCVTGTDFDERMVAAASSAVQSERLCRVAIVRDDLFASDLAPGSFDLVHARFQIAPLGRAEQQLAAYRRLVKPGGWIVLEEPDISSWRVNPAAPAVDELIRAIEAGFLAAGGDFSAGRILPALLRAAGLEPRVDAVVIALEPGHPYLKLPLQFAQSLRPRLASMLGDSRLGVLLDAAAEELEREHAWGTTFTLVQAYAQVGRQMGINNTPGRGAPSG